MQSLNRPIFKKDKPMKHTIHIMPNGELEYIVKPELDCLSTIGSVDQKRISHVEPVSVLPRLAFKMIRRLTDDKSKIAAWTRRWKCKWRVRMLETGFIFGSYSDRLDAIDAEIAFWNEKR